MKSYSSTNQMKSTEQYFPAVLFISMDKVVLSFESVDGILKCDISCHAVYYSVQCGCNY